MKMFAQHKDDKKRVEKALELCSLPSGKVCFQFQDSMYHSYYFFVIFTLQNDTILPEKFTMNLFFTFYQHLVGRIEATRIFDRM